MKIYLSITLLVMLPILYLSCSAKKNVSYKFQLNASNMIQGDTLTVFLSHSLSSDTLVVKIGSTYEKIFTEKGQNRIDIPTKTIKLGQHIIYITVRKDGDVSSKKRMYFTVLSPTTPKTYKYKVVQTFEHLTTSFTQGLTMDNGFLYESTGQYGASKLYKTRWNDKKIVEEAQLPNRFFGEGSTTMGDKLYLLTYKAQKGFVYTKKDFKLIDEFSYASREGWGLTHDDENLIMSDGSSTLTWLDTQKFQPIKKVTVADDKMVYKNINELEYVDGIIYANIWLTKTIIKIDAITGHVLGKIDFSMLPLKNQITGVEDVLNGIAILPNGNLLITGKNWSKMYEVTLY